MCGDGYEGSAYWRRAAMNRLNRSCVLSGGATFVTGGVALGLAYADGSVLNIIPATSTQEAQLQAGQLDVLGITPSDVDSMKKALPKVHVDEYTPNGLSFLYYTPVTDANSPFKDPRMRQAASVAVEELDRLRFADAVHRPG